MSHLYHLCCLYAVVMVLYIWCLCVGRSGVIPTWRPGEIRCESPWNLGGINYSH